MRFDKTHLFVFIAGVVLGLCAGFFSGKAIYDKPIEESVTRDTVTLHDTIPDIAPVPKDSTPVRTIIRWLPMSLPKKSGTNESVDNPYPESTDTVTQWQYFGIAALGASRKEIKRTQRLLQTPNKGFTFSKESLCMSVVCIGNATSLEQWWDTLSHEIDHLQEAVMEYYGVEHGTEDAAWLQGYIMRLIVRAMKADGTM